jgi:hypothetical protein
MQSSGEPMYDQIDGPSNKLEREMNRCLYNVAGVRWPANDQLRDGLQMWQVLNPYYEVIDVCASWRFQKQIGLLQLNRTNKK